MVTSGNFEESVSKVKEEFKAAVEPLGCSVAVNLILVDGNYKKSVSNFIFLLRECTYGREIVHTNFRNEIQ